MQNKNQIIETLKQRICLECGLEPDDYVKVIEIIREELN